MFVSQKEDGMVKVNAAALAAQYLEEAEILKKRYEEIAAKVHTYRGDEGMQQRRKMNVYYDMYLECRATGRYLQRFAEETACEK